MKGNVGDAILTLRRATGLTQEDLAENLGVTQVTLSRWENNLRRPDGPSLEKLAKCLGVSADFLTHDYQLLGAIAADAHMRRQKTTSPAKWKRIEAKLNQYRMHSSFLLEKAPLRPQNYVLQFDPEERSPAEAAMLLRTAWRMPIGAIRNLMQWIESAGVIIIEEDFGTHRIDGMSQWAGDHAVIIVNTQLSMDRKRWTLAHELGHLALHSVYLDIDIEKQANEFAAAFLMPEHVIMPELTNLTLGKLVDLKGEWGVSMQAIFERAYTLQKVDVEARNKFYRQLNSRGWKTKEPGNERIPPETPTLVTSIGEQLTSSGLNETEIAQLLGVQPGTPTPFIPAPRHLQVV